VSRVGAGRTAPVRGRWSPLALAATWLGSGYLPRMPGTWGSLAALPFAAGLVWVGGAWTLAAAALLVGGAGIWVADRYAAGHGAKDPQEVVIDEVAGQWLALVPLALDPLHFAVGFAAFRLVDTLKPWPIRRLERLPGGLGIMADDLAAGIGAAALGYAALALTGHL
jgi:phosphatidylglycerophosphatase A